MEPDDTGAAVADSPAATTEQPTDTSAGTQNTGANGQPSTPDVPFHQHPRWQQVMGENRQMRQAIAELRREQQAARDARQVPMPAEMSHEDAVAEAQALEALERLASKHPKFKALLDHADKLPGLIQSAQGVQSLQKANRDSLNQRGRESISGLVKSENLPTDARFVRRVEHMIAAEIAEMDGGEARFVRGDLSVIQEAFNAIKPDLALISRPAAANVIQTKNNVRNLPPAPRGGGPGQEPPLTLASVGGDENKYRAALRAAAAKIRVAAGG